MLHDNTDTGKPSPEEAKDHAETTMTKDEKSYIEYFINESGMYIPLRCVFLLSGMYVVEKVKQYEHIKPTFNRIFLFKNGGCSIEDSDGHHELHSNTIYLCPINYSFRVSYAVGTEFYYFHINV
ncbi:MAG: hypothetical protein NTX30_22585, partial [Deltaproteobacteria bacterium]|nr:hypothetical protein [Deltaproteobacteria bacterium]